MKKKLGRYLFFMLIPPIGAWLYGSNLEFIYTRGEDCGFFWVIETFMYVFARLSLNLEGVLD